MDHKEQRKEKRQDYFSNVKARLKKKFKQTKATSIKSPGTEQKNSKMASTRKKATVLNVSRSPSIMNPSGRIRNTDLQQYYSMENKREEKKGRKLIQEKPEGTIEYRARMEDTLCSIALKFNSTPNKLVQLNKLYSQSIVPGQDADSAEMSSVQWCSTQHSTASSSSPIRDEIPFSERFLKICCKYFTDGKGVVMGVLFVTPKKIFFDPYKSHPLVVENGCEDYFFACSMQSVISAASHKDVSQMKLYISSPLRKVSVQSNIQQAGKSTSSTDQRKSHHVSTATQIKGKPQPTEINKISLIPADQEARTLTKCIGSSCSCPDSLCQVNEKSFDEIAKLQDSVMYLDLKENGKTENKDTLPFTNTMKCGGDNLISENGHCYCYEKCIRGKKSEPNANHNSNQQLSHILTEEELQKENKLEILCDSVNNTDDKTTSFCEINLSDQGCPEYLWSHMAENTGENLLYPELSRLKAEEVCCITNKAKEDQLRVYGKQDNKAIDQLPALTEKHGLKQDLHHSKDDEDKLRLMFLCLKVRLPMKRTNSLQFGVTTPQDMGQNKSEEYWFAMSQEKVTELHEYLKHWRPDIYLLERMGDTQVDDFVLLDGKCAFSLNENFFDRLFEEWEIITVEDDPLKNCSDIFDSEFGNVAPVLQGKSNLMESFHVEKISKYLPPRTVGHPWLLAYSTSLHGFSLKTLYRKVANADSPVLLVLKDAYGQVFGALTSHPPKPSDRFYGTGETFLYTFSLDFKIFQWTGENSFFIKGSLDSLAIGGGSGHFGLWLDEDLNHGRSNPCTTFNNVVLSTNEDFKVQDLEVWTFR
ncbi:nuclear receptor coactivator 7 isoform X2 [Heptranchias perlo]|uniref:nuclear receptor coactivator 7 isoform X2 n=1 Tax=Heptranchias perlo TaxID=212740 RepID=UPI00355AB635